MRLGFRGRLASVLALWLATSAGIAAAAEQFVPLLVYRTGAYAPNGVPLANGQLDYFNLINERDGGIGGVRILVEECDTAYDPEKGIACYERLKDRGATGAAVFSPFSTGIAYALVERATADRIPLLTLGHGRSDAADGAVFPYVFPLPATYWSQASAMVAYIADAEGGDLADKTLALVHHDSPYGREPIRTLEALSEDLSFALLRFPVAHPGLEQKTTWVNIAERDRPDWVLLWGWGVMNATALREAAAAGYPVNRIIGNPWAAAEVDVAAAGASAQGYRAANFHGSGADFDVHQDILEVLYDAGRGAGERSDVGGVLYNRGVVNAAIVTEAIRRAQALHGVRPLTGEEVRDGFEALDLSAPRLAELGLAGLIQPITLSCADHEGGGPIFIQEWDGAGWRSASPWLPPMHDVVRPLIEASAGRYAETASVTLRRCEVGG